jgi:hypothetical protein
MTAEIAYVITYFGVISYYTKNARSSLAFSFCLFFIELFEKLVAGAHGDERLRGEIEAVDKVDFRALDMCHYLLYNGLSADVIIEIIEADDRIRNDKAEQTESENARILEIEKCKHKVKHKVCIVEHREHCNGIEVIAKHEDRNSNHYHGKRYSQNEVYRFARLVRVCHVEAKEIEYLNEGEANHTGQTLLSGQKHEENVRAHSADKTELSEDIIA